MLPEVVEGSLYYWCYEQGLKHFSLSEVQLAVRLAGRELRDKDIENYWRGWYRSDLYSPDETEDIFTLKRAKAVSTPSKSFLDKGYEEYPIHPYLYQPEIDKRWVPCNKDNKPMCAWGSEQFSLVDAKAHFGCKYLAENLKGTKFIVVDCDGDHEEKLDMRTIARLYHYADMTHVLKKPKKICEYDGYEWTNIQEPASFHLTFTTDRLIPTMHFNDCHMDIMGNAGNQLRYLKNKEWNGLPPIPMTPEIWEELKAFVRQRRSNA